MQPATTQRYQCDIGCSILGTSLILGICFLRAIVALILFQLSGVEIRCGDYNQAVKNYVLLSSFSILWWYNLQRAGSFAIALVIIGTPCSLYSDCVANGWGVFLQADFPINCIFATYYIVNQIYLFWFNRPILAILGEPLLHREHQYPRESST